MLTRSRSYFIIWLMEINWLGPAAAAATFFGVWLGHVSVRKIEREVERVWIPAALALLLGIGLIIASFLTSNLTLSAVCGILAVTLLWDALELTLRQPNRIKHGHAPTNPDNPRHARILAAYPEATTLDLLERDPRGMPYTNEELLSIREQTS